MLIVHSAADNTVPAALSQLLADRMCDVGQVVERRVYDRGQSHVDAVPDAMDDGLEWIGQRLAGEDPVSTCPRLRGLEGARRAVPRRIRTEPLWRRVPSRAWPDLTQRDAVRRRPPTPSG